MSDIDLLQRRVVMMRSALDRMQSDIESVEKRKQRRRVSPVAISLLLAAIGTLASFAFAQTSLVGQSSFRAPFSVVDSFNRPILIVTADKTGRGAYFFSEEGKPIALMANSPDEAGGLVKAIRRDGANTYVALGAFPAALGCIVRSAGKELAFAGKTDSGLGAVQVFDPPAETAQATLLSVANMGQIEIRNKADNIIAVMKKGTNGGGAVETFDANGQAAFWAYGSVTGGDVCVWNPKFGQYCLGPQI